MIEKNSIKNEYVSFLIKAKSNNKKVGSYAAAKANTIINYAGIRKDLLPFIIDGLPSKQNKLLPSSHLEILSPKILKEI